MFGNIQISIRRQLKPQNINEGMGNEWSSASVYKASKYYGKFQDKTPHNIKNTENQCGTLWNEMRLTKENWKQVESMQHLLIIQNTFICSMKWLSLNDVSTLNISLCKGKSES